MKEPQIKVGIIDRTGEIRVRFSGPFRLRHADGSSLGALIEGAYRIGYDPRVSSWRGVRKAERFVRVASLLYPEENATFSIKDVRIGINFHWDQLEDQTFRGELILVHQR